MTKININKIAHQNITIQENGISLIQPIAKNNTIFSIKSRMFPVDQEITFSLEGKNNLLTLDKFVISKDKKEFMGLGSFMNHSCSPNTQIIKTGKNLYDVVSLVSIEANEELTFDYEYLRRNHTSSFNCNCFSPHCRKIVNI